MRKLLWEEAVEQAREQMLRRTMESAQTKSLPPVRLTARDGSRVRLEELASGAPTLVMFWSRYCSPSAHAMPGVADVAERLEQEGMEVVAITGDSPAEAESYLQEGEWNIRAYFDTDGEAAQALNRSGSGSQSGESVSGSTGDSTGHSPGSIARTSRSTLLESPMRDRFPTHERFWLSWRALAVAAGEIR